MWEKGTKVIEIFREEKLRRKNSIKNNSKKKTKKKIIEEKFCVAKAK